MSGSVEKGLLRNAGWSVLVRLAGAGLAFLITIILARLLGARIYGTYAYAMAWVAVLALPATLGFPQVVVRRVSIFRLNAESERAVGIIRVSSRLVVAAGMLIAGAAGLTARLAAGSEWSRDSRLEVFIALAIVPVSALLQVLQAGLRGHGAIVRSQAPEMLIRPSVFLLTFAIVFMLDGGRSAPTVLAINLFAVVVSAGVCLILLGNTISPGLEEWRPPLARIMAWAGEAFPLMLVNGIQLINFQADVLILGTIRGPRELGVYVVARRLADLLAFGLAATETAASPSIASQYAAGDPNGLQDTVQRSARIGVLLMLPVLCLLGLFWRDFLRLLGPAFLEGGLALLVLSVGQAINVGFGPTGQAALQTGHGKGALVCVALGAGVNIVLATMLVPRWGGAGAAAAVTAGMLVWNAALSLYLYRKIHIRTFVQLPRNWGRDTRNG